MQKLQKLLKNKPLVIIFIILVILSLIALFIHFSPYYKELDSKLDCPGSDNDECQDVMVYTNINNPLICILVNGNWQIKQSCGIADCITYSGCYF